MLTTIPRPEAQPASLVGTGALRAMGTAHRDCDTGCGTSRAGHDLNEMRALGLG
ncbi:hypothetical protein [Microbacterium allomyrinae]|uniref:Uncharacterized protein n=1 Tax=Microbacterium allomyrinae TaxID=2830666 RepID=A0A9X1LT30_9MICO|nr:hypothetical protein [Microbacterium allomyrinae]MCC2031465.1 hypothetical protein [Microbacterium allomyrinae]